MCRLKVKEEKAAAVVAGKKKAKLAAEKVLEEKKVSGSLTRARIVEEELMLEQRNRYFIEQNIQRYGEIKSNAGNSKVFYKCARFDSVRLDIIRIL